MIWTINLTDDVIRKLVRTKVIHLTFLCFSSRILIDSLPIYPKPYWIVIAIKAKMLKYC